jgi:hypothetical protein
MMQILTTPAAVLTLLAGTAADLFGFHALFAALAIVSCAGALFTIFILRDPRRASARSAGEITPIAPGL